MGGNRTDIQCVCHTNPYTPCDYPGGCGSSGGCCNTTGQRRCRSGDHCQATDPATHAAYPTSDPLCTACLDAAERSIRTLTYDYLDLAQLHETSLSQALNEKASGSKEAPMLIAAHVEALQAEMVHVTAMWEYELRVTCRLSDPHTYAPLWRTTVYDHLNLIRRGSELYKARPGMIIQRAVALITPRLSKLAALPGTLVCPTGVEDEPATMAGWEAVHQLQHLHSRARATLGRTTRRFWIPGACWRCQAHPVPDVDGPLYRSEPRRFEDPMEVHCATCRATRPYPDYESYMGSLIWPDLPASRVPA